jgi:hypothetical protein
MHSEDMADRLTRVFRSHPQLALEFYCLASEIVDDFEDYGPVLQADEAGAYTERTVIRRLQAVRDDVIHRLQRRRESGDV